MNQLDKGKYPKEELDKIYRGMDYISNITYYNIYSLSSDKGIVLYDFDYSNPDHLFFLSIANIVRSVTGREIYVMGNFFDTVKWNWKNRKKMKKIHYISNKKNGIAISVPTVLYFMSGTLKQWIPNGNFGMIYEEYFK